MATAQNSINNILHLFSPLHEMPTPMLVRDDYIIETPIGCGRIAYSPSSHATALFYARHPDDLAGTRQIDGSIRIDERSKLNASLIRMYDVHHGPDAKWAAADTRQQFDLSWVRRDLQTVAHNLPRAQYREACLHNINQDLFASAFVAYQILPSPTDGLFTVAINTKISDNYSLSGEFLAEPEPQNGGSFLSWQNVATQLAKLHPGSALQLRVQEGQHVRTDFTKAELSDVIQADFSVRLQQIWNGLDPIRWRESPFLPVLRAGAVARQNLKRTMSQGTEALTRQGGAMLIHVLLDGPISTLTSLAIDTTSDFGRKERLNRVPQGWEKLIARNEHRLSTVHSALHSILIKTDPGAFGDLQWLSPELHACNFSALKTPLVKPDADRTFQNWLQSLFLAPYDSSLTFVGEGNQILHPNSTQPIHAAHMKASNGVNILYAPQDYTLYGWYHPTQHITTNRQLPGDAGNYFKENEIAQISFADGSRKFASIHVSDFTKIIRDKLQLTDFVLPEPQTPDRELLNTIVNHGLTAMA